MRVCRSGGANNIRNPPLPAPSSFPPSAPFAFPVSYHSSIWASEIPSDICFFRHQFSSRMVPMLSSRPDSSSIFMSNASWTMRRMRRRLVEIPADWSARIFEALRARPV